MDDLASNPAFTTYAACTAILVVKGLLSAAHTAITRIRSKRFVNPEDAKMLSGTTAESDPAEVAHLLRVQRNDVENLPPFFALGLVFVVMGATPFEASVYFWTFTVARVAHTLLYVAKLQPWRTVAFFLGVACLFGMAAQVLMGALG